MQQPNLAVVIGDDGRVKAQFAGMDAAREAKSFLRDNAGVKFLQGSSIVTAEKAEKALRLGRL